MGKMKSIILVLLAASSLAIFAYHFLGTDYVEGAYRAPPIFSYKCSGLVRVIKKELIPDTGTVKRCYGILKVSEAVIQRTTVLIFSTPSGVEVYIDGKRAEGLTPLLLKIADRPVTLTFKKRGYVDLIMENVDLSTQAPRMDVTLSGRNPEEN